MDGTPLWCLFDSGGTTFLLCPLPFQRSTNSGAQIRNDHYIGLWTIEESRPSDSTTAVITLVIFHTSNTHTAINSAPHIHSYINTSYSVPRSLCLHVLINYAGLHALQEVRRPLILELKTQTHLHA